MIAPLEPGRLDDPVVRRQDVDRDVAYLDRTTVPTHPEPEVEDLTAPDTGSVEPATLPEPDETVLAQLGTSRSCAGGSYVGRVRETERRHLAEEIVELPRQTTPARPYERRATFDRRSAASAQIGHYASFSLRAGP